MNKASLRWSALERVTVAEALANARGGRRGAPPVKNVLDVVPKDVATELFDDAEAVLIALSSLPPPEGDVLAQNLEKLLDRASPLPWRWHDLKLWQLLLDQNDKGILQLGAGEIGIDPDNRNLIADGLEALPRLLAVIERQRRWISDLMAGTFVNCVYCGHRYGPDASTPVAMADVLKAHIAQCPEHPMSKLAAAARPLLEACEHSWGAEMAAFPDTAHVELTPRDLTFGMIRALRAAMPAEGS